MSRAITLIIDKIEYLHYNSTTEGRHMSRKIEILETARRLFNENNTQSVTTNHIAKAMGISPGNLHYHYKNREEIIRLLYKQMQDKTILSVDEAPKSIKELSEHQKILIVIQWEYRFFFREILFLFSRDLELEKMYIIDNIAHRSRIRLIMQSFIESGELIIEDDKILEYVTDAILMTWQFYTSYMQTLGRPLTKESAKEAVEYTNNAMQPFRVKFQNI